MTLHDWIYSNYPSDSSIDGRWGWLHISTLLVCVLLIIGISFFRNKDIRFRRRIIMVIAVIISLFEISRRIINLSRGFSDIGSFLRIMLPRPWCAISCWMVITSVFVNKQFFYNISSMCALINAIIFFAYPSVGFNDKYILYENVYSIVTHMCLLISSISMITLKLTDFKYYRNTIKESAILELITLVIIFLYAFVEIYILKIEADPLYFMTDNEIQQFLGVSYPIYLVIYIVFLVIYFNLFYMIQLFVKKMLNERNVQ